MDFQYSTGLPPFYLMAKPIGAVCNLDCRYCYYLEKEKLYPKDPGKWAMSEKVLENFIVQYIYSTAAPAVLFTWHGGEPILRGMEFFEKVIALQNKHAGGKVIENSRGHIRQRWKAGCVPSTCAIKRPRAIRSG